MKRGLTKALSLLLCLTMCLSLLPVSALAAEKDMEEAPLVVLEEDAAEPVVLSPEEADEATEPEGGAVLPEASVPEPEGGSDPTSLPLGEWTSIDFSEWGEDVPVTFTPEVSGAYFFHTELSEGSAPLTRLYNGADEEDYLCLLTDDFNCFYLLRLEEGVTYTFEITPEMDWGEPSKTFRAIVTLLDPAEFPVLAEGEPVTVPHNEYFDFAWAVFTAPENGTYLFFCSDSNVYPTGRLFNSVWTNIDTQHGFRIFCQLDAGESVYLSSQETGYNEYSISAVRVYEDGGLLWRPLTEDTAAITGYTENLEADAEIPSQIGDYAVTKIDGDAFHGCTDLTSIAVPDTVTFLGNYAFADCVELTDVSLPETMRYVGNGAFANCPALTGVVLPDGLYEIYPYMFENDSALREVTIPASVGYIHYCAFYGCDNLETVYYGGSPSQWNSISIDGDNDPLLDANLICSAEDPEPIDLLLDEPVTAEICENGESEVFRFTAEATGIYTLTLAPDEDLVDCDAFINQEDGGGFSILLSSAWDSGSGYMRDSEFFMEAGTTCIIRPYAGEGSGAGSFIITIHCSCAAPFPTITLGEETTASIDTPRDYACLSFTPEADGTYYFAIESDEYIYAFILNPNCSWLNGNSGYKHTLRADLSAEESYILCLRFNSGYTGQCLVSTHTAQESDGLLWLPDGDDAATIVGYTDAMLADLEIPAQIGGRTVTVISDEAFRGCAQLVSVAVPESVSVIRSYAFSFCAGLETVTLPETMDVIEDGAFANCPALTGVVLPNGIQVIGNDVFKNDTALAEVTIPISVTNINWGAFYGCDNLETVYYGGSPSQWNSISIDGDNDPLLAANLICSAEDPELIPDVPQIFELTEPAAEGVYFQFTPEATGMYSLILTLDEMLDEWGIDFEWQTEDGGYVSYDSYAEDNTRYMTAFLTAGTVYIGQAYNPDGVTGSFTALLHALNVEPFPALAVDEAAVAVIDEPGGYACFSFVPETDGKYTFVFDSPEYAHATLWHSNGSASGGESGYDFSFIVELSAGNTHTLCVRFDDQSLTGEIPVVVRMEQEYNGLLWTPISDSAAAITGYTENLQADAEIPPQIGDFTVTRINADAFHECIDLASITVPDSVQWIGDYAFADCAALTDVSLPESMHYVGNGAFANCPVLTGVVLPEGISYIANYLFMNDAALTEVTIPVSVYEIRWTAFSGCDNLTTVYYDGSPRQWASISIQEENDPLLAANIIFGAEDPEPIDLTLDEPVAAEIDLPDMPADFRFTPEASGVYRLTVTPEDSIPIDRIYIEWQTEDGRVSSLENNEYSDFYTGAAFLTGGEPCTLSVYFGEGYTGAFTAELHCACAEPFPSLSLDEETIAVIDQPGDYACLSFTPETDGIYGFFSDDPAYTVAYLLYGSDVLAQSHTNGVSLFYPLSAGETYLLCLWNGSLHDTARIPVTVKMGGEAGGLLWIPTGEEAASIIGYTGDLQADVEIPSQVGDYTVTEINSSAFSDCSGITSVSIPGSVKRIGGGAFFGCSALETVSLSEGLETIGYDAFYQCSALTEIVIPNSVREIGSSEDGSYVFGYCSSLRSVVLPEGLEAIYNGTFYHCSALTGIVLPEGLEQVGEMAFWGCSSMTEITVPASVRKIAWGAFSGCEALSTVHYGGSPLQWQTISIEDDNDPLFADGLTIDYGAEDPEPVALTLDSEEAVAISDPGDIVYLSFTPAESGWYALEAHSDISIQCTMYDSAWNELSSKFVSDSFAMQFELTEGETYFFVLRQGESDLPGAFTVLLRRSTPYTIPFSTFEELKALTEASYPDIVCFVYANDSEPFSITGDLAMGENQELSGVSVLTVESGVTAELRGIEVDKLVNNGTLTMKPAPERDYGRIRDQIPDVENNGVMYMEGYYYGDDYSGDGVIESRNGNRLIIYKYVYDEDTLRSILSGKVGSGLLITVLLQTDVTLAEDLEVRPGFDLVVDEHVLTIGPSVRLINNGSINLYGTLEIRGTLENSGEIFLWIPYDFDASVPYLMILDDGGQYVGAGSISVLCERDGDPNLQLVGFDPDAFIIELNDDDPERTCDYYTYTLKPDSFGQCGDDLTWELADDGTLTISGSGDMWDFESGNAPWAAFLPSITTIILPEGLTSIGSEAFDGCWNLTSVSIPEGVTRIGDWAFQDCDELLTFTIPASVSELGVAPISSCGSMLSISVAEDNPWFKSVGGVVYSKDGTELIVCPGGRTGDFTVPADVILIRNWAFCGCWYLTSIELPEGIPEIGEGTFWRCYSLTSIIVPAGVSFIGYAAFYECDNLTSVVFSNDLATIGEYAFAGCSSLEVIDMPLSVYSIEEGAFKDCDNLTAVNYGGSSLQWKAIRIESENDPLLNADVTYGAEDPEITALSVGQPSIADVTAPGESAFFSFTPAESGYYVFTSDMELDTFAALYTADWTWIIDDDERGDYGNFLIDQYLTQGETYYLVARFWDASVTGSFPVKAIKAGVSANGLVWIPLDGDAAGIVDHTEALKPQLSIPTLLEGCAVTKIYSDAFAGCDALESVVIPETVSWIGSSAFSGCSALESVTLPPSMEEIEYNAFSGTALTTVVLPDGLDYIGTRMFEECASLAEISIPGTVLYIDEFAFNNCSALADVYYGGSEGRWSAVAIQTGNEPLLDAQIHFSDDPITDTFCSYSELVQNLAAGRTYQVYRGIVPFLLTEDLTIPEEVALEVTAQPMEVADGAVLTVNGCLGYGELLVNGEMVVGETGLVEPRTGFGSSLAVNGSAAVSGSLIAAGITGEDRITYSGWGQLTRKLPIANQEDLNAALAAAAAESRTNIYFDLCVNDSFALTEDTEFIRQTGLHNDHWWSSGDYTLTVPAGITLTISQDAWAWIDSRGIQVEGTLCNDGMIHMQYGFISLEDGGRYTGTGPLYISGERDIDPNAFLPGFDPDDFLIETSMDDPENNWIEYVYTLKSASPVVASGQCGDDVTWTLTDDGTLTISGTGPMWDYTLSDKPEYVSYLAGIKTAVIKQGVTRIGAQAFYDYKSMTDVSISGSVTDIGEAAFMGCDSLTSVILPDGVESIETDAFGHCKSLSYISISASVNNIAIWAFVHSDSLMNIDVDEDNAVYTSIDGVLFSKDKTTLHIFPGGRSGSYTIPDGVESIADRAFMACEKLTSVSIPASLMWIGAWAFEYCTGMTEFIVDEGSSKYSSADGVLFNKDKTTLLKYPWAKSGSYTIPDTVTVIGNESFCGKLTDVTIPASVTSIGSFAFADCNELQTITFLGNAPAFGYYVFAGVIATAYYPANNATWTGEVMQGYDGTITWVPSAPQNGWQKIDGAWYYYEDGSRVTGWKQISSKWYYFDSTGVMVSGWRQIGSKWYYFESGGAMVSGWKQISSKWYYFESSGAMVTGWKQISSKWYYFESGGAMVSGWKQISSKWYYFESGGAMVSGWKQISSKWYYFESGGAMVSGWKQIGGKQYYFESGGAMVTGLKQVDGKWYYFESSGVLYATAGWKQIDSKWYYFDSNGAAQTGWQQISSKWYYFESSGVMVSGWQKIDGIWYYFESGGTMVTGWKQISGKWYYFQSNGAMKTGWLKLNDKWYYFESSGAMVANTSKTINGKTYNFDASGVCTNP